MKSVLSLLSVILMLVVPPRLSAQTRRALVIGLGEQLDNSWAKINGDKDVDYVVEMLTDAGYEDIRTLVNKQATKAEIVAAFHGMAERSGEGDMIYIHFSGHGQRVTDLNGDEKDGWDESWIPYDAYLEYDEKHDRGEKHLIDDEINVLLTEIRNNIGESGKMLVVVDACHSGDSDRSGENEEAVRGVYDYFLIPVKDRGHAKSGDVQWLMISACRHNQSNYEINDPQKGQMGKLTCALYSLAKEGNVNRETIDSFMLMHRGKHPQDPMLPDNETESCRISDFF